MKTSKSLLPPEMQVGGKYLVIKPAHSFGEIDGQIVDFPERRSEIEVLPKPAKVAVFDGETTVTERLPEHLSQNDWYRVRNLTTGNSYWLNSQGLEISQLTSN